ncbi:NAD(P)-dependent oxidoreductase [Alkalicoccus urumqiensis]|uniref:Oxidoreductase n=1 Tax=Alkalicoccus urumqiensis TaxID=1548213 RepID=A0A2P6MDC1_ALKUR|nr:NAD(P)-dependent oxidoreductase [Alkalicoccus urumqiensis]PRO64263.1 oxidoreductase [Alkalicoccus urumqiensis]
MKKAGFIGTGVMGSAMAGHLMDAGFEVHIYTRTKKKAEPLLEKGAVWQEDPASLTKAVDAVLTMVGYPEDVRDIYFGENGILDNGREGTLLVDLTTSRPDLAEQIAEEASKRGMHAVDAPVSGGDVGAEEGTLAVMSGGTKKAFSLAEPLFHAFGRRIEYMGGPGAGQLTKAANQIAIAGTMMGVSESLAFAKESGLDPDQVLSVIETGAAGSFSMSKLGPRMLSGDNEPGFYIKHFVKDMRIAIETARELDLDLPGLEQAEKLYTKLMQEGWEDAGTQALFQYYVKNR